ncbi:MAG: TPM domain-containing protein [Oscillospiraceae bacterium]
MKRFALLLLCAAVMIMSASVSAGAKYGEVADAAFQQVGNEYSGINSVGYKAILDDKSDVISDNEYNKLLAMLDDTAQMIQCHVAVVIEDSLNGMSDRQYAENYAKKSFPVDSDVVVLLLNNDRSNKKYTDWIYTYGAATDKFGDNKDGIFDAIYYGMGDYQEDIRDYDYYSGIVGLCNALCDLYVNGDDSQYYSSSSFSGSFGGIVLVLGLHIGVPGFITFVIVYCIAKGYKKKAPISARHYMDSSRTVFTDRRDIYIRETTTSVKISSSGSGSHGGGRRSGGGGGRRR